MEIIEINKQDILLSDIQKCIDQFREIQLNEKEKKIIIHATVKITNINPLLIAYFILFKTIMPELSISLDIERTDESTAYKLKQFHMYAFLVTGQNVFRFKIDTGKVKETEPDYEKLSRIPTNHYIYSEYFSPFLIINKDDEEMYDFIFKKPLSLHENKLQDNISLKSINWEEKGQECKDILHRAIFPPDNLEPPKNRDKRLILILNLGRMAFFKALEQAKIEMAYFAEIYGRENFNVPDVSGQWKIKYYKEVKPVFSELVKKPLIYQFVFGMIMSTKMLQDPKSEKDQITDKNYKETALKIKNLWYFTLDLVQGIKELTQNIYEHSDPGIGVVSLRMFDIEEWVKNKAGDHNSIYTEYKNLLEKKYYEEYKATREEVLTPEKWKADEFKKYSMIDIHVIDLGTKGVIPTLLTETGKYIENYIKDSPVCADIQDDIINLKNGHIKFSNLIAPDQMQLNSQSKRSIAHLGLLILSKLVEKNHGMMIASSQNIDRQRESVTMLKASGNGEYETKEDECIIKHGTFYNIHFPIKPVVSYTPHLPHQVKMPADTSPKDIKGLEQLLEYEFVHQGDDIPSQPENSDNNTKFLIEIKPPRENIVYRKDETAVWQSLKEQINKFKDKTNIINCINLKEASLNGSQLFRLIGTYELYFSGIPVIIYNLRNELLQDTIIINDMFCKINKHLAYWNDNHSILIYSFIETDSKCHFHFSDLLGGKTENEFLTINHKMINYPFSSVSIGKNSEEQANCDINITVDNLFFYNRHNLLPFDLLLKYSKTYSLFEQNSLFILNNKIK